MNENETTMNATMNTATTAALREELAIAERLEIDAWGEHRYNGLEISDLPSFWAGSDLCNVRQCDGQRLRDVFDYENFEEAWANVTIRDIPSPSDSYEARLYWQELSAKYVKLLKTLIEVMNNECA